jgi:hypothetical protein
LKKAGANFADHAAAKPEIREQLVAHRKDGRICRLIAKSCGLIQPACVKNQLIRGLVEAKLTAKKFFGEAKVFASGIGQR